MGSSLFLQKEDIMNSYYSCIGDDMFIQFHLSWKGLALLTYMAVAIGQEAGHVMSGPSH